METFMCSTEPDPEKREQPVKYSSVDVLRRMTFHAYVMAPDKKASLIFRPDGFELMRGRDGIRFKLPLTPQNPGVYWSPDSKMLTFWVPPETGNRSALATLDIRKIDPSQAGQVPPYQIVYEPPIDHAPFGLEWSPKGDAVYVIERFMVDEEVFSRIVRAPLRGEVREVVRMSGQIDFFMPPVSRFEHGGGPDSRPYWIVFGHARGLFVTDPSGKYVRELSDLPAIGLHNVEWNPRKDQVALFFRRSIRNRKGKVFRGVYVAHLDRVGKKGAEAVEAFYDKADVHTLWYSPKGTYLSWATPDAVYYKRVGDPEEQVVRVAGVYEGLELDVKGMTWHESERKLAFTAANRLFVVEVGKPDAVATDLGKFGSTGTHFAAEPLWVGDQVYLTVFGDLTKSKRPQFSAAVEGADGKSGETSEVEKVPAGSGTGGGR